MFRRLPVEIPNSVPVPKEIKGIVQSNWLPSPANGTISVMLRFYAPKAQTLDGSRNPPAIKRTLRRATISA
jgi:hypothetical protein